MVVVVVVVLVEGSGSGGGGEDLIPVRATPAHAQETVAEWFKFLIVKVY